MLYNHKSPKHPKETIKRIKETLPGKPLYETYKQRIRLHPNNPAPTIVSGGVRPQWQLAHYRENRGISVREMARLQSFKDSFLFSDNMVSGRRTVGNAVPPLLSFVIAKHIKENYLNKEEEK